MKTEDTKELLMIILIGGHMLDRIALTSYLVILSELLSIPEDSDFNEDLEFNMSSQSAMFVTKCADLISSELWDEFLAEVKRPLLENEQYELLQELYL